MLKIPETWVMDTAGRVKLKYDISIESSPTFYGLLTLQFLTSTEYLALLSRTISVRAMKHGSCKDL